MDKFNKDGARNMGEDCPVCYNTLNEENETRKCPECENAVHKDCLDKWLNVNKTCVFCRSDIFKELKHTNEGYVNLL
jgi:hypothetical protein